MTVLLTDEAGLESWRARWQELPLPHVDADLDHFRSVLRADPGVLGPRVLVVPGSAGPLIVVARLVEGSHPGRSAPVRVRVRTLLVSFGGVLGAEDEADLAAAARAVRDLLASGGADVAIWQKVPTHSPLAAALHGPGSRRSFTRPQCSWWEAELPESWEALLAGRSSKSRRQIRYDDNRVRRRLEGRLELRRPDGPDDLAQLTEDLSAVAARSYQGDAGLSVLTDHTQWQLLTAAAQDGSLRVWMVDVDQRPVAFWWGIVRRGVLTVGTPGYDPAFSRDRLGYFAFRRMLEGACADPTIRQIDFGPGDADYKERFGTRSTEVADVVQYAPRPRARVAAAAIRGQDTAVTAMRSAARTVGRTNELRRSWRRRRSASGDVVAAATPGGDPRAPQPTP